MITKYCQRLLAISIASTSIAIGAIPAVAEVDSKIHALCLDAKDYSGCIRENKAQGTESSQKSINNSCSEKGSGKKLRKNIFGTFCMDDSEYAKFICREMPNRPECKKQETVVYSQQEMNECIKRVYETDEGGCRMASRNSGDYDCPPGKSLRQKTTFLGLIKLGKVCLSDYEVEALRQGERHRALENFSNSMDRLSESMQPPRVVNCYSNTYGNYTSTSCY